MFNTGELFGGFEVWASEPVLYEAHYFGLRLVVPGEFRSEVYQELLPAGRGSWCVGFRRPDGVCQCLYTPFASRADAEQARATYPGAKTARLWCEVRVQRVGGAVKAHAGLSWFFRPGRDYAPFEIGFLPAEDAARLAALQDRYWADWIADENNRRRLNHAEATSAAALRSDRSRFAKDSSWPAECYECGATYADLGRVDWDAMVCDRCKDA